MDNLLLVRILWTALIIGGGLLLYTLINRWLLQRNKAGASKVPEITSGRLAILYFTTPHCGPCRTIQRPALNIVREKYGAEVQIVEVDATSRPELASAWEVLSVPTTYIIDQNGNPRHVNHGAVEAEKLFKQLEKIR